MRQHGFGENGPKGRLVRGIPTVSEIYIMIELPNKMTVPYIFPINEIYWCSQIPISTYDLTIN